MAARIRFRRWRCRFRRQQGPLIRFWDAEWNHLHTEPQKIESWAAWRRRQVRRLPIRNVIGSQSQPSQEKK